MKEYYTLQDVSGELKRIIKGENIGYNIICDLSNDLYFKISKQNRNCNIFNFPPFSNNLLYITKIMETKKVFTKENFEDLTNICEKIIALSNENVEGALMYIQMECLADRIKDFKNNPIVKTSGVL